MDTAALVARSRTSPEAELGARQPVPPPVLDDLDGIDLGIKAISALVPLKRGDMVAVHGEAETGLYVLLCELTRRLADRGASVLWTTWEMRAWQARELETVAAAAGILEDVEILCATGPALHRTDRYRYANGSPGALSRAAPAPHPATQTGVPGEVVPYREVMAELAQLIG